MAELDDPGLLRLYLGEVIPSGGTDADTMFTNDDIDTLLTQAGTPVSAAVLGWQAKAAQFARLVDVSEGPSKRFLQQRFENAAAMIEHYSSQAGGVGAGRTRVKKIHRPGGEVVREP